jgi:septin family protein
MIHPLLTCLAAPVLVQESRTKRTHIEDTRVHVVLYFISPNSRGLRQLDIEAMKALQHKVLCTPGQMHTRQLAFNASSAFVLVHAL